MSVLAIVLVSVVGYCVPWGLSMYWHLMTMSSSRRWDGGNVFECAFFGLFWPITLVPQFVARLSRREKKGSHRQTRQEKKLAKKVADKQRELETARQVQALQDEIDRIALS